MKIYSEMDLPFRAEQTLQDILRIVKEHHDLRPADLAKIHQAILSALEDVWDHVAEVHDRGRRR